MEEESSLVIVLENLVHSFPVDEKEAASLLLHDRDFLRQPADKENEDTTVSWLSGIANPKFIDRLLQAFEREPRGSLRVLLNGFKRLRMALNSSMGIHSK